MIILYVYLLISIVLMLIQCWKVRDDFTALSPDVKVFAIASIVCYAPFINILFFIILYYPKLYLKK